MNTRRSRSLAFVVTLYTALVIALGMGAYGVYQYLVMPGQTVASLVLEHAWHVAVFAVVIYLALSLVLHGNVVRPVQQLNVKLYAITKGDLSPVSVASNVEEIQEIAGVVNFLLERIDAPVRGVSVADLAGSSKTLRAIAHGSAALGDTDRNSLVDIAGRIDSMVSALSMDSLQKPDEGGGSQPPKRQG